MGRTVATMRSLAMAVILGLVILAMAEAQYGSCDWSQCRYDRYLAQRCCSSSGTCCDFANGGNNGNNNNGGFNNNNKPGSCPPYNGRKKRSPRGRFPGNNGNGRFPGNNGYNNGGQGYNPGYNNGYNPGYGNGNGYNPGYGNGNGYNNNGGSCIRDSECSADLKCCYLRSAYQCTRPNYYG